MARGVGVELLIKHEVKPSALSRNKTPTSSAINCIKHSHSTLNDIECLVQGDGYLLVFHFLITHSARPYFSSTPARDDKVGSSG